MAVQIILRNDTAANWTSANPVLARGEIGLERDTMRFKIGDGTSTWSALAYRGADGAPGGSVFETVVDFGSVPVLDASFSWAHVGALTSQRVIASAALTSDELEMDPLAVSAVVSATDVITASVSGLRGPVSGTRTLYYTIGD
jgi:hypothetical protein